MTRIATLNIVVYHYRQKFNEENNAPESDRITRRQRRQSGLKSGGRGSRLKNQFSRQISEKFRFFPGNFTKDFDLSRQISEKFDFFSGNFTKSFYFPGKDFRMTSFSVYPDKIGHLQLLQWANYSISIQKSPLSDILPVHDKIIIIFHDPSTTPTPLRPPTTPSPKSGGS